MLNASILKSESRGFLLLFLSALLLHTVFWTFAPPLFMANYRPDTMEMMVIGQNWILTTYKHPAFQGWVVEICSKLFCDAEFAPYLASQTATILIILAAWKLALRVLPPKLALLAALSLLSFYYLHYDSTLYNNITFTRSFWLLAIYFLFCALEDNKKRDWIFTGVSLGLGIYCQFSIFLLVASILVFMFLDRDARKYWKTSGPYLSITVCLLMFLPLLIWTVQNHFPQLQYAAVSIGKKSPSLVDHIRAPLSFSLSQIPAVLVLLLPLFPVIGIRWNLDWTKIFTKQGRFLIGLFFIPCVLQLLMALVFAGKVRSAHGSWLWLLFPVTLLFVLKNVNESYFYRSIKIVFANIVLFAVISIMVIQLSPLLTKKDSRFHFDGKGLAQTAQRIWEENGGTGNLPFVRGDDHLTENVCVYLHPHPKVFTPLWATEEEFRQKGGLLIWVISGRHRRHLGDSTFGDKAVYYDSKEPPNEWLRQFPEARILPPLEISPKTLIPLPPDKIGIAVVPPIEK